MAKHAEGTFTLTGFDEQTSAELADGAKVTTAAIGQDYEGGFEGHGASDNVMAYRPDGTAVIVSFMRMSGSLDGQRGTFVVEERGTYDGTTARAEWTVVSGSGTDGLTGLTGTGSSEAPHGPNGTWSLHYDLG